MEVVAAAALDLPLAPTKEILLGQQQPAGRQGLGIGFRGQELHQGGQGHGPVLTLQQQPGGGQVLAAGRSRRQSCGAELPRQSPQAGRGGRAWGQGGNQV